MKSAPIIRTVNAGSLALAIRRYADGRFGFDFQPPGGARAKVRLATLFDAEVRARELVGAAKAGKVQRLEIDPDEYAEFLLWKAQRKKPARIDELVPAMLKGKEMKGRACGTIRSLASTLDPFAERFPGPIADLQRDDVEQWITVRDVGPRRWNNMLSAILGLHRYARMSGFLPAELTPVERIERRILIRGQVETYTPAEVAALLAAVPKEWLPLIVFGAFCGLRPEEICPDPRNSAKPGVRWENIVWGKQKVDVPAAVSKVRRRRFAPLTKPAAAFLQDWKRERGPVVPSGDRHQLSGGWAERAGVQLKSNGLRHSFASYRLALTNNTAALALELGNSPAMIFRHYLDLKHEAEAKKYFAIRPE